MIITGGRVFGEDGTFSVRDVYIENGKIVESSAHVRDRSIVDARGLLVIPGLIDIHSHGAAGYDFSDADNQGLKKILEYEHSHGITSYCPTTMTMSQEKLLAVLRSAKEITKPESDSPDDGMTENVKETKGSAESGFCRYARIAGINMEGPFLDPARKGAHREKDIQKPDAAFFHRCMEACGGIIKLVTLAPNMPGALEVIRELKDEVTVSLGHTDADYEVCREALKAGACHVTHLFNAMAPFGHREPGLIGAAAEDTCCFAELITDGVHVHESMVRAAFSMFPGRIVLVSDSMRATGLGDGSYELGGHEVIVSGNRAVLADGTIAGSVTNLFDCMRKAVSFGVPRETAIAAATINPAKAVDIYDTAGSVSPGKAADILLVDEELNLVRVL